MVAAWRVGSREARDCREHCRQVQARSGDSGALGASSSRRSPTNYSLPDPVAEDGGRAAATLDQAKTLAHEFYQKAVEIDKEHAKLKAENEEQLAKMKDPNEKFDPLPNGIKRKLIQHQIDLKGMDREASYLWTDMFEKDLPESPVNRQRRGEEEARPVQAHRLGAAAPPESRFRRRTSSA